MVTWISVCVQVDRKMGAHILGYLFNDIFVTLAQLYSNNSNICEDGIVMLIIHNYYCINASTLCPLPCHYSWFYENHKHLCWLSIKIACRQDSRKLLTIDIFMQKRRITWACIWTKIYVYIFKQNNSKLSCQIVTNFFKWIIKTIASKY